MSDTFDHAVDAYESLWNDQGPEDYTLYIHPKRHTCKYCGKDNLEWSDLDEGWRLTCRDTGAIHSCSAFRRQWR